MYVVLGQEMIKQNCCEKFRKLWKSRTSWDEMRKILIALCWQRWQMMCQPADGVPIEEMIIQLICFGGQRSLTSQTKLWPMAGTDTAMYNKLRKWFYSSYVLKPPLYQPFGQNSQTKLWPMGMTDTGNGHVQRYISRKAFELSISKTHKQVAQQNNVK